MEFTQQELDDLGVLLCSLKTISEFLKNVKCLDSDGFYISENVCNPNPPLNFTQTTSVMFGDNLRDIEQVIIRFLDGVLSVAGLGDSFSNIANQIECVCNADINFAPLNNLKDLDLPVTALNNNLEQISNNTFPIQNLLPLIENIRDKFIEPQIVAQIPISEYIYDPNNFEGSVLPGGYVDWKGDNQLLSVEGATYRTFHALIDGFSRQSSSSKPPQWTADYFFLSPVTASSGGDYFVDGGGNSSAVNPQDEPFGNILKIFPYYQPLQTFTVDANQVNTFYNRPIEANPPSIPASPSIRVSKFQQPNVVVDFYEPNLVTEDPFLSSFPEPYRSTIDTTHSIRFYDYFSNGRAYSIYFGLTGCNQSSVYLLNDGSITDLNKNPTIVNSNNMGFCRMGMITSTQTPLGYSREVGERRILNLLHPNLNY